MNKESKNYPYYPKITAINTSAYIHPSRHFLCLFTYMCTYFSQKCDHMVSLADIVLFDVLRFFM